MRIKYLYRSLFLTVIFLSLLSSCSKDRDDELSLFGNWIEEAPVESRTEIYFYPENELTIRFGDGSVEEYYYKIEKDSIFLNTERNFQDKEVVMKLFFKQLDDISFQISNLYANIPENEPSYIIFEREVF